MPKAMPSFLHFDLHILFLLFLTIPFHSNSQPTNPEQALLLQLKQYWSNPPSISHWNQSSDHCSWPEINCTGGFVAGLQLIDKNITGAVPPFICELKNLTYLELQYNNIVGPFPASLYNCSNLEHLDISQNYFIGRIPDDINRLSPRLRFLNVGANNFTGDIPVGVSRFPELRTLHLFQNLFNGSFPSEIGDLQNLETLGLAFNGFVPATIPSSFTQLKKLKVFWMTEANLIGEIPENIGNLTALEFLDLSVNNLVGSIPNNLFLLNNLTQLYLYKNKLSGPIPHSVQSLNLQIIDLSSNNLTGTIPDDFGKLTQLTNLSLFFNQLTGELPVSLGRLPALKDIRIFSNNFFGEIPPDFGQYSELQSFQVATNRLTGKLPENLCAHGKLLGVVAFDNDLSGELPFSLGNCSSLLVVRIHGNRFSGKIPDGLWTSMNLSWLMISDNSFTGQLPDTVGLNLSILEMNNNQFSGGIPAGISSWENLVIFRASNNLFNGTIPQELTALPSLTDLLLDGNRLSGNLPGIIISWMSLTILNLSHNQLSGEIPSEIGNLPNLNGLDLSQNQISGEIPPSIGFLRLSSLNLSSNQFTGRIPGEFENAVFDNSFLDNPNLCASNPSLGLKSCNSQPRKSSRTSSHFIAIFTSIAVVLFVLAILFTFFTIRSFQKRKGGVDSTWKLTSFQRLNFREPVILSSLTENNLIGSGGSGQVYQVAVNRAGEYVAVKKIWKKKLLDQKLEKEFLAEVEILGTIRHANIVKLMCFISSEDSKLLVYEYMENRSLDIWLHGKKRSPQISGSGPSIVLDWPRRLQIAVGAARGLCYMHHDCSPPIIHRDLKSSNILLDSEFNAKIADFGLARMLVKHGESNTMSTVAGSFGYIAPEYARTTRVNEKIDVYSFGVILLELTTGREANDGDENSSLAQWAWRHILEGKSIDEALYEDIKEPCYLDEMLGIFKLGIICTGQLPSTRPTIKEVLQILLRCSRVPAYGDRCVGGEYDAAPLLKNSRRERMLERDDDLISII